MVDFVVLFLEQLRKASNKLKIVAVCEFNFLKSFNGQTQPLITIDKSKGKNSTDNSTDKMILTCGI